jgi:hypothetical protein
MAARLVAVSAQGTDAPPLGAVSGAINKQPAAARTGLDPAKTRGKGKRDRAVKNKAKKVRTASLRGMKAIVSHEKMQGRGVGSIQLKETLPGTHIRVTTCNAAKKGVNCLANLQHPAHGKRRRHGQAGGTSP